MPCAKPGSDRLGDFCAASVCRWMPFVEAADAGVELIVCITEGIPVMDMMQASSATAIKGRFLCASIGPNCPGLVTHRLR